MSEFLAIAEEINKEYFACDSLQFYRSTSHIDFWAVAIALNTRDANQELGWEMFLLQQPFQNSMQKLRQMLHKHVAKDEYFHPAVTMLDVLLKTPILQYISWSDFLKKLDCVNHQPTIDCLTLFKKLKDEPFET